MSPEEKAREIFLSWADWVSRTQTNDISLRISKIVDLFAEAIPRDVSDEEIEAATIKCSQEYFGPICRDKGEWLRGVNKMPSILPYQVCEAMEYCFMNGAKWYANQIVGDKK